MADTHEPAAASAVADQGPAADNRAGQSPPAAGSPAAEASTTAAVAPAAAVAAVAAAAPPASSTPAPASHAPSPQAAPSASSPGGEIGAPNRPAPLEATIEVDDDAATTAPSLSSGDDDEGYADTDARSTATTSLSSSVRDYTFENSRRYHKYQEGKYHFPNDEPEQEREDMRHCMMVHVGGGALHYAPLKNPQRVLDVGTGTGIWAIDKVIGIDLSPIQPSWVPVNVRFLVDDAEQPWVAEPNSYDYVHMRSMAPAIKDWPKLMAQAFTALKPGGWIEIQDINWVYHCDDGSMGPDYAVAQMASYIRQGLEAFGIQITAAEKNPERLAAAGFVDIRHTLDKVPVGTWPRDPNMKTIGLYNRSAVYDGLQGITMGPLTRGLKWTPEEVEVFLVRVRKDLLNSRIHSYVYMHTLCGQKPF